jgi:hypothetical protein
VRFSGEIGGAAKVLNYVLEDEVSAIRPIGIRTLAILAISHWNSNSRRHQNSASDAVNERQKAAL